MKFSIEVLSVSTETKTTTKGTTYVMIDLAFKNLTSGKTEGKKLVPFGDSEAVYKVFKDAKNGTQFSVTSEKPEGAQYWQWTAAEAVAPNAAGSGLSKEKAAAFTPSPKSTYETPEERAKKQVYIVKQSSISNAIAILSLGAKTPPSLASVLDLAQSLTSWVLEEKKVPLADLPNDDFDEVEVV